jgi:RNA polymerase sigma-54 factor
LSENPMLEADEESLDQKSDEEKTVEDEADKREERTADLEKDVEPAAQSSDESEDIEAYFQQYFDDGFRALAMESKEAPPLENIVTKSISLWDHLNWQADLTFFDDKEKEIAQYIIGNINEDGYLIVSPEEVAAATESSVEDVEKIRSKVKAFDPVGVASLSLKESLLAQMDYFEISDAIARKIVEEHIALLERSEYSQLAKKLGLNLKEIKAHIEVIKGLDPTPGRKYSEERTVYVIPDIIVKKEDDELKIVLNDEGLPRLKINSYYRKLLAKTAKDEKEARVFLKEKMKKAFWFLRSLDQRNQTIHKVANYILDRQKNFIELGIDYIQPLTLIELAQEIGVHESTVGRVVANKYIMTPRGVFPLKYFFHKSLEGDFGEEISSLRVKEKIKKLVENEDRKNPLSDLEIEEILAKTNFKIARRTVAKYRKQLKIPPSHMRKRKYWMEDSE